MRTFVDTDVLICAFRGKEPFASAAFRILDDPERQFVVTDILKLELLPKARFHKQDDEISFYQSFFEKASHFVPITPDTTGEALALASKYDLTACDSLHIECALRAEAKQFVTGEKPTNPFFRVREKDLSVISLRSLVEVAS